MQALRELQPLLQSPQVGLAAKAAVIHASGVAEDHDKEVAVNRLAAELDVSLFIASSVCKQSCSHSRISTSLPVIPCLVLPGAKHCSTAISSIAAGHVSVAHWLPGTIQSLCRMCFGTSAWGHCQPLLVGLGPGASA